ncbi:D-hexose-6-phosphate mutarotase [Phycicoccus duodecadis]|uniref:Putative glucose-6-phosphate 1-epimerase n=1 Tax=Phycicoccus duodecadis TaxID=173053 RepID=A0A2N3YIP6_9MICO|nr:D-hexose-6-phosphate mutarotase [Phycicoccus duodecadis]PKW26721.1 dihydroxy-acid dehydratase/glucose-6-phosphate 1-epimerase [Phycicoccus duodecadis]
MNASTTSRRVDGPAGTAEVLDTGALVLRWAPAGRDPVLFAHPGVGSDPAGPPHAGVPVCWPWFGPGPEPDAPAHGIARAAVWRYLGTTSDGDVTVVAHRLTPDEATSPWWPHPYRLDLEATFGSALTLRLTTANLGDEPFVVGEALHAYLAVGDVREVRVGGLDGAAFHDKVAGEDRVQEGDLVLTGETDRVYRSTAPVVVSDPVLRRRLVVEAEGAADRVVWNPWAGKAAGIDDIGGHWSRFVCVEAANALADVVTVAPGATHTLTYRLSVEDL